MRGLSVHGLRGLRVYGLRVGARERVRQRVSRGQGDDRRLLGGRRENGGRGGERGGAVRDEGRRTKEDSGRELRVREDAV